jgi:hypothetical protein
MTQLGKVSGEQKKLTVGSSAVAKTPVVDNKRPDHSLTDANLSLFLILAGQLARNSVMLVGLSTHQFQANEQSDFEQTINRDSYLSQTIDNNW